MSHSHGMDASMSRASSGIRTEWTDPFQILTERFSKIHLGFRHVSSFLNEDDSKAARVDNLDHISDFLPRL